MFPKTVLVVDDDPHIREVLRFTLEKEGMTVIEADNGKSGLAEALAHRPELLVLDIMMPEMSGLDLCREFRKTSETPIIFLSSRDEELDRIIGLEIGGDDYLTKPFSPRELVARIRVIFKRLLPVAPLAPALAELCHGDLVLNLGNFSVSWQQQAVILTVTEFNLLAHLMRHPQKVSTRDELIQADLFKDIISDRTIDSHIRRLRHKFTLAGCAEVVETVHGFGYKLGDCR
jgi:two-component system, OmpR family, response regulator